MKTGNMELVKLQLLTKCKRTYCKEWKCGHYWTGTSFYSIIHSL